MDHSSKSVATHSTAAAAKRGLVAIRSGCVFFLAFGLAHADMAPEAPLENPSMVGTIIFGLLFAGFCIGLVWYVWRNEKKQQREKKALEEKSSGAAK